MGTTHAAAAVAVAFAVLLLLSPRARDEFALREAAEEALDPAAEEQRIEIVRIEMPPEPDLEPKAAADPPPPRPEPPAPPSQPAQTVPEAEVLARGGSLLRAGKFPRLRATYSRIGFPAYRDAVLDLGGAFFLFDPMTRQPVAKVDPRTGLVSAERVRVDLSRWPRDVTRHLPETLRLGQAHYGPRITRVILLPPARLDAALLGALEDHLRALGLDAQSLLRVDVAYELRSGSLHCDVLLVALRDGSERPVSLEIDLSGGMTRGGIAS
jgi:hypothetical protein